ncbi:hypothetical protein [Nocardiopsis dassonvillei]|uniref:hypothetical protein n=1 Tax=Nocardiopsis dassonvillei TaxID=2014 RepID=UPI003643A5BD
MTEEAMESGYECARAERCANSWTHDDTLHGAWGPSPLCDADRAHLLRALGDLPELYAWLWMQLPATQTSAAAAAIGAHPAHAPLPLRGDVDALMRELLDVLASWEERVRDAARLPDHTVGPHAGGRALTTMVRTLTAHLDTLLFLDAEPMTRTVPLDQAATLPPDTLGTVRAGGVQVLRDLGGGDAATELFALHARCRSRAGVTRRTTPVRGVPCPHCDLVALARTAGSDHVWCQGCGAQLTEEDYTRWVSLAAGGAW